MKRKEYTRPELSEMVIVPSQNLLFDSGEEKTDNLINLSDLLQGVDPV